MENFIKQLNLTTIISVLGLFISLATLAYNLLTKRKRLSIRIFSIDADKDIMFITMAIENLSQLPIAITNIKYVSEHEKKSCTPIPTLVFESTKKCGTVVIEHRSVYSEKLPIQISPLGAFSGVILFEHLQELPKNPPTSLTVEVSTNRGKAFQKTIALSADLYFQRRPY